MSEKPQIIIADTLFNPKSIAVVGISKESGTKNQRYGRGAGIVGVLHKLGYSGKIYPISPSADFEVKGHKVYPSLAAVPEAVDLAIVATSAAHVPEILEDCIVAKTRNVHVFSSGFSEVGNENGIELENKVKDICRHAGLPLVGPNCLGVHVPKAKVSIFYPRAQEPGNVAFVSQSGGHAIRFVKSAHQYGLAISKVISYGNAAVLEATDYLEYLAADRETKFIGLYLEGTRDGKRLLNLVKKMNVTKPVFIWKGGLTESGARAASAHTGSLAGNREIWQAFFKYTGAVQIGSIEEMLDTIMIFSCTNPPLGKHAGLITMGGGQSVAGADLFTMSGLEVPPLPLETRNKLLKFVPAINTGVINPVDLGLSVGDISVFEHTLETLYTEPLLDFLVAHVNIDLMSDINLNGLYHLIDRICIDSYSGMMPKPLVVVLERCEQGLFSRQLELQQKLLKAGIVTYLSLPRACRAVANLIDYHESIKKSGITE